MTIGVFDSGVGGLTVLRELLRLIPQAHYLYFGDTARLPYGSKSAATVARYATSSARFLQDRGANLLVIACNSATALAMDAIEKSVGVPALGVIAPGAQRAAQISRSKKVVVIGTEATVGSGAYLRALAACGVSARQKACPLFVPLVEEGWTEHSVTEQVARIYLAEIFDGGSPPPASPATARAPSPDVLLLGCTHYPLLKPLLRRLVPEDVAIVDSAESVAQAVAEFVSPDVRAKAKTAAAISTPSIQFFVSDSVEKFHRLGQRFFDAKIDHVSHVDLET